MQGYGEWYNNDDYYKGNALDGQWHGKGTFKWENGAVFEGTYVKGVENGPGK